MRRREEKEDWQSGGKREHCKFGQSVFPACAGGIPQRSSCWARGQGARIPFFVPQELLSFGGEPFFILSHCCTDMAPTL